MYGQDLIDRSHSRKAGKFGSWGALSVGRWGIVGSDGKGNFREAGESRNTSITTAMVDWIRVPRSNFLVYSHSQVVVILQEQVLCIAVRFRF